jgi:hypothetical protein
MHAASVATHASGASVSKADPSLSQLWSGEGERRNLCHVKDGHCPSAEGGRGEYVWMAVCTMVWDLMRARSISVISSSDSQNEAAAAKAMTLSAYTVTPLA